MNLDWIIDLKNPIYRGFYPKIDPFDRKHFYIGDGWGSTFPSMKLRKLNIETGLEINSVRIRNSIRAIHFEANSEKLFVASDNRVFMLNRSTLEIIKNFRKGILKYSDFISSNDENKLLIMNYRGKFLMIFDYSIGKGIKKKIGESCAGIFQETNGTFLIFDSFKGTILRYNILQNSSELLYETSPFSRALLHENGMVYLKHGRIEYGEQGIWSIKSTRDIEMFDINSLESKRIVNFDTENENFLVSENGNDFLFWNNNHFQIISIPDGRLKQEYKFDSGFQILNIMEKQNKIFLYPNHKNDNRLFCYSF